MSGPGVSGFIARPTHAPTARIRPGPPPHPPGGQRPLTQAPCTSAPAFPMATGPLSGPGVGAFIARRTHAPTHPQPASDLRLFPTHLGPAPTDAGAMHIRPVVSKVHRPAFPMATGPLSGPGVGGLAGPFCAMDGAKRAYMDVLAACPANPPTPGQPATHRPQGCSCSCVALAQAQALAPIPHLQPITSPHPVHSPPAPRFPQPTR